MLIAIYTAWLVMIVQDTGRVSVCVYVLKVACVCVCVCVWVCMYMNTDAYLLVLLYFTSRRDLFIRP